MKVDIFFLVLLLAISIVFPHLLKVDVPNKTVYTFTWSNPYVPTPMVVKKGLFNEENEGTEWWSNLEDLNKAYADHLKYLMENFEGMNGDLGGVLRERNETIGVEQS